MRVECPVLSVDLLKLGERHQGATPAPERVILAVAALECGPAAPPRVRGAETLVSESP